MTASWLTRKENARGITLIDSGAPLGSAVGGLAVAAIITLTGSWRLSFLIVGAISVVLSLAVCAYIRNRPREHSRVNEAEAALVEAGQTAAEPAADAQTGPAGPRRPGRAADREPHRRPRRPRSRDAGRMACGHVHPRRPAERRGEDLRPVRARPAVDGRVECVDRTGDRGHVRPRARHVR
ncbi:MFS transporter [Nocardia sp. CA2R105]|nr:MFS transporter [Nocardia coffeae]